MPFEIYAARPDAVFVTLSGLGVTPPNGATHIDASFEKLGRMFEAMRDADVSEIVFAGGLERPSLNPTKFDLKMMRLVPRLTQAFRAGDDALLRTVIDIFEGDGFAVKGAHDIAPSLLAEAGWSAGPKPGKALLSDAARAAEIIAVLSPMDVGQAVVVSGGHCLGIETMPGTDALLQFVADTRGDHKGGVLAKLPKAGQELRVDMPTIGPETLRKAGAAGLSGIMVAGDACLVLEKPKVEAMAREMGISVWTGDRP